MAGGRAGCVSRSARAALLRGRRRRAGAAAVLGLAVAGIFSSLALPAGAVTTRTPSSATQTVIVLLRDGHRGRDVHSPAVGRAVRQQQAPVIAQLHAEGARSVTSLMALDALIARVPSSEAERLGRDPSVAQVVPDAVIPVHEPAAALAALPSAMLPVHTSARQLSTPAVRPDIAPSICGTAASPEVDPEALSLTRSTQANALGYDGAGVSVAIIGIGGPVDTTIPDFQRNPSYASAGSTAGTPVVTQANFSGDPAGTPSGITDGFVAASAIAAQGNTTYNLDNYISSAHSLPSPCDITITGDAPGSSLTDLSIFSGNHETTESDTLQAINYAVQNGVKVLDEDLPAVNLPDTAQDATRAANDAAVAAGVTVVTSTGDAGPTNMVLSPASDPNVLSVGTSTSFRAYEQDFYGGINATTPNANDGHWINDNISSLSGGGFTQAGNTLDLVAPGDLNWSECSTDTSLYPECTNNTGSPSPFTLTGGTDQSAAFAAGAAADVIQAYASTHGGNDPSPALIKQILMSSADDIDAPAQEQGAGRLDVEAAVKDAVSLPGTSGTPSGGLLVSPNQINVSQAPGASATRQISVTNTGSSTASVALSTRALTDQVANSSGSFCLNPSSGSSGQCGPPTANTFQIWSGTTEVYQEETFSLPATASPSRLVFSASYPDTGQSSVLHVALLDPSGSYAGYSLPQGLSDHASIEVADPAAGTWTAIFFTAQDNNGTTGTSGTINWDAQTLGSAPAGTITPSSLTIDPGATKTAQLKVTSPQTAGDAAQSVVLSTSGEQTTVPVTVRTTVPLSTAGGTFSGVLTGGNGREGTGQENAYSFDVPAGKPALHAQLSFTDSQDAVSAYLVDPDGQAVSSGSSVSLDSSQSEQNGSALDLYHVAPTAGVWTLVVAWANPVSGAELNDPFTGRIAFDQLAIANGGLPDSAAAELRAGKTYTYKLTVKNTSSETLNLFADPRLNTQKTIVLANQNTAVNAGSMTLPLSPGLNYPYYAVPPYTSVLNASLDGSAPVTFDLGSISGDPDLSPEVTVAGSKGSASGNSASLTFSEPEVTPGLWYLNPSEIGPYGPSGAPSATASAQLTATTRAFDPNVSSSTGDWWSQVGIGQHGVPFNPVNLAPGATGTISVAIKPRGVPGRRVSGTLYLDDYYPSAQIGTPVGEGDIAAVPYSYVIPGPDLALADTAAARTSLGRLITERLRVSNHGPGSTTGAVLTDKLPAGTTLYAVWVSGAAHACTGLSRVRCLLGRIDDGSTVEVTLLLATHHGGRLIDQATVIPSHGPDPHPANNAATAATNVTTSGALTTPRIRTGPASEITSAAATLSGMVNPAGHRGTYAFEVGTSAQDLHALPSRSAGHGSTVTGVVQHVPGLRPNTTYYYRLELSSLKGLLLGSVRTFRTSPG
jgi:hypothetical protein